MTMPSVPVVGQEAPDFRLRGHDGTFYTLSEYRGQQPVVLVFYPQAFSPVCMHQLPEIERMRSEFEAAGVQLFAISVDSHHVQRAFREHLHLGFPLLSDWEHEASSAYGLYSPEYRTSTRAILAVDRAGRIAHVELSTNPGDIAHEPSHAAALAAVRG